MGEPLTSMTAAQEAAVQEINNNWPIATYGMEPDGTVTFTCDDGDQGRIDADGSWEWA